MRARERGSRRASRRGRSSRRPAGFIHSHQEAATQAQKGLPTHEPQGASQRHIMEDMLPTR